MKRTHFEHHGKDDTWLYIAKQKVAQNNVDKGAEKGKIQKKLNPLVKAIKMHKALKEVDADELMKAEGLVLHPGPRIELDKEILATLRQAILSCHHIKMVYQAKGTNKNHTYSLVPYGFLYGHRDHYLVAKHSDGYDNGKAHNFSLQQIKSVEILPDIFDSSKFDLNEYAMESFGAFHEEPFDVEWLFSADVAKEAANFIFHPKQKLTHNPDGTLTVKFRAGGKMEMDWFLYTWGDDVKVIKPKDWD